MSIDELRRDLHNKEVSLQARLAQFLSFARGRGAHYDGLLIELGEPLLQERNEHSVSAHMDAMLKEIDYIVRQRSAKLRR